VALPPSEADGDSSADAQIILVIVDRIVKVREA
jgi:hypothetical protein